MELILSYSFALIIGGSVMLIGAFLGLAYSKKVETETIKIFQNEKITLSDRYIQPFRMHQNGEVRIQLEVKKTDSTEDTSFKSYLTDLYANTDLHYSYGPTYLEFNQLGAFDKTIDLKMGEYNMVYNKNLDEKDIDITYSITLHYSKRPYSLYNDWALAFIDIGVSMLLVGLTIYLGI